MVWRACRCRRARGRARASRGRRVLMPGGRRCVPARRGGKGAEGPATACASPSTSTRAPRPLVTLGFPAAPRPRRARRGLCAARAPPASGATARCVRPAPLRERWRSPGRPRSRPGAEAGRLPCSAQIRSKSTPRCTPCPRAARLQAATASAGASGAAAWAGRSTWRVRRPRPKWTRWPSGSPRAPWRWSGTTTHTCRCGWPGTSRCKAPPRCFSGWRASPSRPWPAAWGAWSGRTTSSQ
mmetsp:Transcript_279/g.613  ORF Transcript_279/g.613 Transcript_279/m.613 type:complete len:240 (-) Transcript_279:1082-1801(-)